MSGRWLRTVVANTSAFVSLAVPRADAAVDTDTLDPFQYLLSSCEVFVPPEVVAELRDITQYQDSHAAAANNVLANVLGVDGFLTDEFRGTDFPLIHPVLQGPRIVPALRLIVDYARNGHLSHEETQTLLTTTSPHRSWEHSPYVTQLLHRLEEQPVSECRHRTASAAADTRKHSLAHRPLTARDSVSLALLRFVHEDAAARIIHAALAGSGDDRGDLALSESARTVDCPPSDVAG